MMCNNPKLNLVIMNAFIKFGVILSSRNEILAQIKGHYSGTNLGKMKCNNPKLDLVNMNA